jgi:hypothetical protein
MAAGATIGSNHNSRANDGEIEAGRGFWPGLSTSVKHSSRFASYCLLAKGDYRFELDIRLPFCLVDDDRSADRLVLVPAFWWTHDLYALMRNEGKFKGRDRRAVKVQVVELSPFAPDTAEEIIAAIGLLESWMEAAGLREAGAGAAAAEELLIPPRTAENSDRAAMVVKPLRALAAYREMLAWYAANAVLESLEAAPAGALGSSLAALDAAAGKGGSGRDSDWENLGGQLAPARRVEALLDRVRSGAVASWDDMHAGYAALAADYGADRSRHAWACLRLLHGDAEGAPSLLGRAMSALERLARRVEEQVLASRAKDHANAFRRATFRSEAEMLAVVGRPEDNPFVRRTAAEMEGLRARAAAMALVSKALAGR